MEDPESGMLFEDNPSGPEHLRRLIIKFSLPEDPEAARVERAFSAIAAAAGITVTPSWVWEGERSALCSVRFDRHAGKRLHVATPSALTGRSIQERSHDYVDFLAFTRKLTGDMGQVKEAFRRMVFNVAVVNTDDHAKNHSYLCDGKTWKLSPAYDLTFVPGTHGAPATREMAIKGSVLETPLATLLDVGECAGLTRAHCRDLAHQVFEGVAQAPRHLKEAGLSKGRARDILDALGHELSRLRIASAINRKAVPTLGKTGKMGAVAQRPLDHSK